MTDFQRLIDAVREARADIAPTYHEYVQLAFALATECGEAGRSAFHDLCRYSTKYDAKNADKVYTSALSTGRGDVTIATAYHLAKQAGVTVSYEERGRSDKGQPMKGAVGAVGAVPFSPHTHTHACEGNSTGKQPEEEQIDERNIVELLPGSEPPSPLPLLPDADWPEPIATILSYATTPYQRDILLLAVLTVLGASLERHVRFYYGGRALSPCLQTFIVAPPASGKGLLSMVRLLVEPIHNELRQRVERETEEFRKKKAEYDTLGKKRGEVEMPQPPRNRMFLISGNNTGTGILQNIMDADGTGLIFEPEADTLSTAIGSEYGRFSDTLRKCFDHEWLAYNRRTDREYREVRKSYLSVLLSGTPAQVRPLIPSAENGLFSRQVFYYMRGVQVWQNQFLRSETADLEPLFTAMGKEWKKRLDDLKQRGLFVVQLTEEQQEAFNTCFSALFTRAGLTNEAEMNSSVVRLAINLCRMLSVVAMLRGGYTPAQDIPADNLKDGIVQRWEVPVNDADFRAVLALAEPLYRHATHILSMLPAVEINRRTNTERDALFAALPKVFTRQQLLEEAGRQKINCDTALCWVKRLVKRGELERVDGKGTYARTHV